MKTKCKDTVKKILSKVLRFKVLCIIVAVLVLFSVFQLLTRDKFVFKIETLSSYSVNDNIELDITVLKQNDMRYSSMYWDSYDSGYDFSYEEETLSDKLLKKLTNDNVKLKVALYDSKGKKLKGTSETIKGTLKEVNNVEIELPENLEPGTYVLKAKAKKGLLYDYVEKDLNLNTSSSDIITISMDKGIYKPGDEVKFRALITKNVDSTPIVEDDVIVSIYDGNENRVYYEEAKTSEFGIVSGLFNLGTEVNSGTYKLVIKVGNKEKVQAFKVDSYTEERFKIEVVNDKMAFLTNEDISFEVNANYFFGEPVVDADIEVSTYDGRYSEKLKTDSNGKAKFTIKNNKSGNYKYLVKITDVSNYYVEKEHEVIVTDSGYDIDILPEYGDLVTGVKNRIYFYVKDLEQKPIADAICEFSCRGILREVKTDSNGTGWVELSSNDIGSINSGSQREISLKVKLADGSEIVQNDKVNIISVNNIIRTDNVLYNQGETIEYSLGNYSEENEKIYVVKNSELITSVDVTEAEGKIELENVYGLIDLYIVGKNENRGNKLNKRTIFIKPKEDMKITLSTDSKEYKPSDNMTLNISNSTKEDIAYLISIIDTANLNMADNDLNIDKIKLALEDVKFADGIDAATVYATIMSNADEIELEKLLMKQSSSAFSVYNNTEYPEIDLDIYRMIIIISILAIVSIIALIFIIYNLSGRNDNRLINSLSRSLIIVILMTVFLSVIFFETLYIPEILSIILALVISIVLYNTVLLKYEKYIANSIYECITTIMTIIVFGAIIQIIDYIGGFITIIVGAVLGIIIYAKRKTFIGKLLKEIVKINVKTLVIVFVANLLTGLLDELLNLSYVIYEICPIIMVILIYAVLYMYKKEKNDIKAEKNIAEATGKHKDLFYYIGVGFVVFCVLSTLGMINITRNFSTNIDSGWNESQSIPSGDFDIDVKYDSFTNSGAASDNSSASLNIPNIDLPLDISSFSTSKNSVSQMEESAVDSSEEIISVENISSEEIVKIRNVFLESLTFMPEVIGKDGNTDVDIKLSDNITTWKVQVVGNTKEGNIAYSNTEFKVFKEFFVDFTVPQNLKVGDKISIPASVYNYTENPLSIDLNVKEDSWFKLINGGKYNVTVNPDGQELVYIEIEVLKQGNENKLRIEVSSNGLKDIVEKVVPVDFKGIELSEISANGNTNDDISGQVLFTDEFIEGSNSVTVNLYPNLMSFAIDGMDSILKMPTGCFEQVSSSLYPDIMVLTYIENMGLTEENKELKEKAINYINKGYQKLLTYEVPGEPGGFSLYGRPKAEPMLTAYGLMELNDLSKVYDIDEKVLERMENYLKTKQTNDGSFDVKKYSSSVVSKRDVASSAYILWALSEYNPESKMVEKGIEYIKDNIDDVEDNYILALMVNTLVNAKDSSADKYIDKLIDNLKEDKNYNCKYLTSSYIDHMGTSGNRMNIQTTALLSMALSKENKKDSINQELIDYIISQRGNTSWGTTHATVFALRAINEYNANSKTVDQKIEVTVGNETKEVELKKSGISFVSLKFDNLENSDSVYYDISGIKANIYYEVLKNYYVEYNEYDGEELLVLNSSFSNTSLNVNDIITQSITINNYLAKSLDNIMVEVQIPQGFVVETDSLDFLVANDLIEKYETNYGKVFLYLRELNIGKVRNLNIKYRALYPVNITGGAVKVYDYYNPEIVEYTSPVNITVSK